MSKISSLDAVKIQARSITPIVRALEKKLGRADAHRLVGDAIAESWADYLATRVPPGSHPRAGNMSFPVESIIVKDSADEYAVNMTQCDFADYFRSIGAADIGALLTCGVDYAVTDRLHSDWTLTRNQTLMMGASHCDFCWRRKSDG
jgi:hypothetical protein